MVVEVTSKAQFVGSSQRKAPSLELVRPGVWALGLPMAIGIVPYSLCYLIEDSVGGMHVIDPGWDSDENWHLLLNALAQIGRSPSDIRSITVTHLHADHLGMAPRLQAESPGLLQLHPSEQAAIERHYAFGWSPDTIAQEVRDWGVPEQEQDELLSMPPSRDLSSLTADRLIRDGDVLDVDGFRIAVMHTPGHSAGHICLREDERGLLFTGDHLLPNVQTGLGLGGPMEDNALHAYLIALERVGGLDGHEALPGHGYRFLGLSERAAQAAQHHLDRAREVAVILQEQEGRSVWAIAEQLSWRRGWLALRGHARYSALQQTDVYREYVLDIGADHLLASERNAAFLRP